MSKRVNTESNADQLPDMLRSPSNAGHGKKLSCAFDDSKQETHQTERAEDSERRKRNWRRVTEED